jgi:hypothetical protein
MVDYHIFCCNMSVFACPIIAKSQCWLFALICQYLPPYSTSGIIAVVSKIIYFAAKVQGKICIRSYFNKINTLQHIGIKFNLKRNVYVVSNRNFHSNVNVLGRFYKQSLTSLYRSTLFGIFLNPDSKQKFLQVEQRQLS